jgi:hypothetical protein
MPEPFGGEVPTGENVAHQIPEQIRKSVAVGERLTTFLTVGAGLRLVQFGGDEWARPPRGIAGNGPPIAAQ